MLSQDYPWFGGENYLGKVWSPKGCTSHPPVDLTMPGRTRGHHKGPGVLVHQHSPSTASLPSLCLVVQQHPMLQGSVHPSAPVVSWAPGAGRSHPHNGQGIASIFSHPTEIFSPAMHSTAQILTFLITPPSEESSLWVSSQGTWKQQLLAFVISSY